MGRILNFGLVLILCALVPPVELFGVFVVGVQDF